MGEIRSNVTLENTVDRGVFNRGQGQETDIRRTTIDGMVDTGAVSLILPQNIVERLGLDQQGTAVVTYADERQDERPLAGPVTVRIGNRAMVTNCIVGPPRSEPLIGQVVLEMLDLIADCANHTLGPRYPDYPVLKAKAARTGEHEDRRTSEHEAIATDLGHDDQPEVVEAIRENRPPRGWTVEQEGDGVFRARAGERSTPDNASAYGALIDAWRAVLPDPPEPTASNRWGRTSPHWSGVRAERERARLPHAERSGRSAHES